MRKIEFNIHWRDIERWAWEETISTYTLYLFWKKKLTWCSGEVRECHFSTLGHWCERLKEQWERAPCRWAYRLVNVGEELAGRELNDIFERRGWRDDETAINQLCETQLVVKINFDETSSITDITIVGLTQETHFEEGSREWPCAFIIVRWLTAVLEIHPFRWSSILECMKRTMTYVRRIARCMPCVNHEPAAKNIEMMNMGIKQARLTNLEIRQQADCPVNSCAYYSWLNWELLYFDSRRFCRRSIQRYQALSKSPNLTTLYLDSIQHFCDCCV